MGGGSFKRSLNNANLGWIDYIPGTIITTSLHYLLIFFFGMCMLKKDEEYELKSKKIHKKTPRAIGHKFNYKLKLNG